MNGFNGGNFYRDRDHYTQLFYHHQVMWRQILVQKHRTKHEKLKILENSVNVASILSEASRRLRMKRHIVTIYLSLEMDAVKYMPVVFLITSIPRRRQRLT